MQTKKFCRKCDFRHVPPTGGNCKRTQDLEVQLSTSPVTQMSNDSSSDLSLVSSDVEDVQFKTTTESIQVKILEELQKVNRRLYLVEEDMATVKKMTHQKIWRLSNFSKSKVQQCTNSIVLESYSSSEGSGKAGSCLPLVGSLQYRTLANCMCWFPLPFQLPVVI